MAYDRRHYADLDVLYEEAMTGPDVSPGAALAAMRTPKQLRCPVCGETFTGRGRARYCSQRCKERAYRARKREGGKR